MVQPELICSGQRHNPKARLEEERRNGTEHMACSGYEGGPYVGTLYYLMTVVVLGWWMLVPCLLSPF